MDSATVEKIIKEIGNIAPAHEGEHVGRVVAVGDGVVAIDGLSKAVMSEVLVFEEDGVRATILGDTARVSEGMTVKSSGKILSVPSSEELLGRVVNALGEPIDGKGPFKKTTLMT